MTTTRRALLRTGAAGAGAVAVAPVVSAPADAAVSYRPGRYRATRVPSRATLHVLERFTYGYNPSLRRQVERAGGLTPWFEGQLRPRRDRFFTDSSEWWPAINASHTTIVSRDKSGAQGLSQANADHQRWVMVRRVHSGRQVQEVMAEFWEHHFHVPALGGPSAPWRAAFGKELYDGALGRFADLLHTSTTHPAMGTYLDNGASTKKAPNENLGRELLELHTVGVGNYTEDDVKGSARILTGWRVDVWKDAPEDWRAYYDPPSHWTGEVRVLGFVDTNADPDGQALTRRYTDHLARHPRTAEHLARKLAVRFVSDEPSAALVGRLAEVYLDQDTRIAPVLRALVADEEFRAARGRKVRTGSDDVAATYRVLGSRIARPEAEGAAAHAIVWQVRSLGLMPLGWPRPDGMPDTAAAWASPSRFLASGDVHRKMSGGWWPREDVRHRSPASWLPQRRIRFKHLVDHLSRSILGQVSDSRLLQACCQATGIAPGEVITRDHPLVRWQMPLLLTALLDSPKHLTR